MPDGPSIIIGPSLPTPGSFLKSRLCLLLTSTFFLTLLALTSFHRPSPHSTGFQFPGLLPSSFTHTLQSFPNGIYPTPGLLPAQKRRYAHLRHPSIPGIKHSSKGKYLFVSLTRNIESQLPDLLNTLAVLTDFLGPARVRFSIYEGPSSDNTSSILQHDLIPLLLGLGVRSDEIIIETDRPKVDFDTKNRIEALADLRNEALSPLWLRDGWGNSTSTIIYFNDVYLHARDVLELLHQHVKAGEKEGRETGITTGLDWWKRHPEYYYDVWVARTMEGDLFYPIDPPSWSPSDKFLSTSPSSREAYDNLKPFQVFSSWAGMAVLTPTPFLPPHNVRFRRGRENECAASECELVSRDLWEKGWGRVQVVPSVQLAYDRETALDIAQTLQTQMEELGWHEYTPNIRDDPYVNWITDPPTQVKCHSWPEKHGLDGNVWETVDWVPPYLGYGA